MTNRTEVINKTIAAIEKAAPERVEMSYFVSSDNRCNTAACIAGWVFLANTPKTEPIYNVSDTVLGLLNISVDQEDKLFFMVEDNNEVQTALIAAGAKSGFNYRGNLSSFDALASEVRKRAAINVLTILRDTDKVDWPTAITEAVKAKA